eukprot:256096-Chlamydomonas_euryale.AAC.8
MPTAMHTHEIYSGSRACIDVRCRHKQCRKPRATCTCNQVDQLGAQNTRQLASGTSPAPVRWPSQGGPRTAGQAGIGAFPGGPD